MLTPPAGTNTASGEPTGADSALAKTSRAFASRSNNELQSYKEVMADSTKWHAAIKSELDFLIENETWEAGVIPPGRCKFPSKWVFEPKVNADVSLS